MAKVLGVDHLSLSVGNFEFSRKFYGVYFVDPDGMELEGMYYGRPTRKKP